MTSIKQLFVPVDAAAYRTRKPVGGADYLLERIARDKWRITITNSKNKEIKLITGHTDPDWTQVQEAMTEMAPSELTDEKMLNTFISKLSAMISKDTNRIVVGLGEHAIAVTKTENTTQVEWSTDTPDYILDLNTRIHDIGQYTTICIGQQVTCSNESLTAPVVIIVTDINRINIGFIGTVKNTQYGQEFEPYYHN